MIDYLAAIRRESERFSYLIRNVPPGANVPSCPGWSMADLTWHLAEVQYFWASIVTELLDTPDPVGELARPGDDDLPDLFDQQSARLIAALQAHDPAEACWSWHDSGHRVGWVLRRQAHEALIHRVDAELGRGGEFDIDGSLATDGVDEVLTVMLDAGSIPDWSAFTADGRTAVITAAAGPSWTMELGRFTGTSPTTGNTYDDPALLLGPLSAAPTVSIGGSGADLDLWLWGRSSIDELRIDGDYAAADFIRAAAADGTQ